ncbi:FAD-binding oxidoreductase [Mycolicibacterium sediminis]|uniref:Putative FAD-linked oxidoreductase YgaK n=1 Tax=Mycolicibacterium sediminis TaxID=1286180 RepID=A0A7I7QRU9_9MYCO|nr:FAD-binding oxidoreductase [Mycolicibacterium sediminis]BBY28995.1 putative FAD-linked oxidoreductase YgaK [Mycolicibacterium sediminis]
MTAENVAVRAASTPAELTGRVVRPVDDDYAVARRSWNELFSHRPRVIVYAQTTQDVVTALAWARWHDVPVRVRSGGHCLEGWSTVDDGVVIDVSEMKSAAIDPAAGTATVGAGLNQLEAVTALGAAGFVAPTGTEGSVGLVGATLGGGFGLLTRPFGMASDNLLAAEVVVASGDTGAEVLAVDENDHADLLWALRGAGNGNFGIVTSLTYAIHPVAQAIYVTANWTGLGDLVEVFDTWQRSAPGADRRLTSQLEIHGDAISLIGVLVSDSEAEALELLAPVLSIGTPVVTATAGSWADTYAGFQLPTEDEPANWKFTSQFMTQPFPVEAIEVVRSFMTTAPTADCNYFTNAFGGAVVDGEPSGGSVFAHRDALFYAEPGAGWGARGADPGPDGDALTATCLAWVADFSRALAPFANGAYVNVPNADAEDWAEQYWGRGVERLRRVKAAYDPDGVFTYAQSVPPARDPSS